MDVGMVQKKDVRNSSFELLRIVAMLMILLHHFSMTYGLNSDVLYVRLWAQFFYVGGKVGVNCFVLISAYFMFERGFRIERLLRLHQQLLFYGVVCLLIGEIFIPDTITIGGILRSFFPVIFNHYWFITTFFGLLLLAPFLNILIVNMSFKMHSLIIIVGLFLFSIIPTFTIQTPFNDELSWFVFLYLLSAYCKKYDTILKRFLSKGWIFIVTWMLIYLASVTMTLLENQIPALAEGVNFFTGMYILPQVINSLALFLWFEKQTISSRMINKVGGHTVASYLIQSNYIFIPIRIALLESVMRMTSTLLYPVLLVLISLALFIGSFVIDWFREYLMNSRLLYGVSRRELQFWEMLKKLTYKRLEEMKR